MIERPVILLTFANQQDAYLDNLKKREQKAQLYPKYTP